MDGSRHGLPRSNVKKYKRKSVLPPVEVPVVEIIEEEIVPLEQSEIDRMLNRILKTEKNNDAA